MKYNAIVMSVALLSLSGLAGGVHVELELVGAQTPALYPFDGVRLELTRTGAGEGAPALLADEPLQVLNATAVNVFNNAPPSPNLVNVRVEGAAPSLQLFPGDTVEVELLVVSRGAYDPSSFQPPPVEGTPPMQGGAEGTEA